MERSSRGEWAAIKEVVSPHSEEARRCPADRSDTWRIVAPTYPPKEADVLKKAKTKASQILAGSAELYREIALSALSLVPRR